MSTSGTVAAVDFGASSGRVILGHVGPNELSIRGVARFANTPVRIIDGLHWNILDLYRGALGGLRAAVREDPALRSVAVDSWAVDYALLRGERMLGNPVHYRDERTAAGVDAVHAKISPAELYDRNGLQFLPFNTLYQLAADRLAGNLDGADGMLLIPDLITFWLTGEKVAERSNASTTGLVNVADSQWDDDLIARLGLPRALFSPLVDAGNRVGNVTPRILAEIGTTRPLTVLTVGSHDTASAVVAVPMQSDTAAYISSGTWSLAGVELASPVLSDASRAANFTNEGGVDGRFRYLRNVMGLWLLSESIRTWEQAGSSYDLPALIVQAGAVTDPVTIFDVDDPRFLPPGDMPSRIREYCAEHDLQPPRTNVELVRSIIESLAAAYAQTLQLAASLSGTRVSVVHIVGGGSQNELLCQLTANHTGLRVLAGPVEATAIGNVLVQARAQGLVTGSLESLRALVALAFAPKPYDPHA
ncbi:rhamnulokinase family protein [Cryobacterium sp. PH31-O1]|uniref:rhamnulokinase n=1 Tax=Cryobacterium sp. PH31-O1 TaxID=3046306 RepID=UPI0024B92C57|nr:rhamnulokinase family protein [Cryobacterium sp. PH31-O1]MDJ0338759.1 rhamnulokinase family protein [Cryobacterium sp. PH31-O1]